MSDEINNIEPQQTTVPLVIVCGFCFEHYKGNATIEFNFRDEAVYFYCSKCKKMNKMSLKAMVAKPYPRARLT